MNGSAQLHTPQAPSLTLPRFAGEGGLGAVDNARARQGMKGTSAALGAPSPAKRGRVREGACAAEEFAS
jgi:hypothetical protein